MNSRTIDVVTDWETVAASDGYEGLHELADAEFSGAVSAGMTWAFFLNGRVVGVFEGGIGDFEDAELTAYRAADPSLPLLFAMQERGGETQARYYTNKTPLSDADQTLSNGGFTGYVELSENVLSGDYYVVYYGGKSMSAAFVGSSERLVTGEDAFETAADEVGIYEVVDVDVEIVDLPEPPGAEDEEPGEEPEPEADTDAAETAETDDPEPEPEHEEPVDAGEESVDASEEAGEAASEPSTETDDAAASDADTAGVDRDGDDAATGEETGVAGDDARPNTASAGSTGPEPAEESPADEAKAPGTGSAADAAGTAGTTDTAPTAGRSASAGGGADTTAPSPAGESDAGVFSDEARWREAKTIPSLDPGESSSNGTTESAASADSDRGPTRERTARMQRQQTARKAAQSRTSASSSGGAAASTQRRNRPSSEPSAERLQNQLSQARDRVEALEAEREDLTAERAERRERIEKLETEREEYRDRIETLEAERETLEAEVERLEAELRETSDGAPQAPAQSMSPEAALSGTNLFVRYDRKSEATLEHAHDGEAARADVSENLRLEHHTTFETDGLAVDDRPYEEFLHGSTEYAFANWVVTDLLYEIGETGNQSGLSGVFDSIPAIDRIELFGTVGVDTVDGVEQRDFDVIFRDKMGDALFVADINASRNATTEAMVGSLVENTNTIASNDEALAAGFYVTESFYEPGALETVAEETGGGLLSRSKKLSHVKLSRKRGYHLCLVEARNGEFHLNVPDL
ncbi:hypothetical protein DVK02_01095 [Halobellus sp. Atlit-31R]|nr:hypothetical protein DVK02_01095 [Halobellus sp. Atlit-31R]